MNKADKRKIDKIRKKISQNKTSGIGNADKLRKEFFEAQRKARS